MTDPGGFGAAQRREVVRGTPASQQRGVMLEAIELALVGSESERGADLPKIRRLDRPDWRSRRPAQVTADESRPNETRPRRRFRCTSNNEIAAGVTPEILAACPSVAGRTAASFCLTSNESARTSP